APGDAHGIGIGPTRPRSAPRSHPHKWGPCSAVPPIPAPPLDALKPRPLRWRDADDGETNFFGPVVEELVLHDVRRHVYRVTGTHLLLTDLAAFVLPLDDPAPAEYEIHFLEIGGVFDFQPFRPVFRVLVPMMGAMA